MKGYHDIAHDGGSDVLGQVAEQRSRIERNLAGVRHVLAVGSGKGGVGKSTLALLIASAMARRGLSIAILDADLNGPSQARLAGVSDVPPIPGENGLAMPRASLGIGVISLGSFLPEARSLEFDSVATGNSHVWRAMREFGVLGQLLATVHWGRLDCLIVDLPPGAERTCQHAEFLGPRAAFVLVTHPSDLSRGVVARSVAALRRIEARVLGYVENMDGYLCRECGTVRPLFRSSGAVPLGIPRLGGVPFDPEVTSRCDEGGALDAGGPVADAIAQIADRLRRELETST